jgi:hypothetical protein
LVTDGRLGKQVGGLVDLVGVIDALGPGALVAVWRARAESLTYFSLHDEGVLDDAQARRVTGVELRRAALGVASIIDGVFECWRRGEGTPWLTVVAVDSSWWEVYSDDLTVLDALRQRFHDITPPFPLADGTFRGPR